MTALADAHARRAFFHVVRAQPFGGTLHPGQVSGMEALLDACPPDLSTEALAYCFATAIHETARTMLPIKEHGGAAYYQRMYDITGDRPAKAKELGNTVPGDGAAFAGRGYVQLTGRSNYRRATGELQNRGYLTRAQDLTATPDLAMAPDVAAAVMFLGMQEGWFTGRKLRDYFGPSLSDPTGARRIINGQDKAAEIAAYHRAFLKALREAGHKPGAVDARVPVPPVEVTPLPPPAAGPVFAPAPRNPGPAPIPAPAQPRAPEHAGSAQTVRTGGFWAAISSLFKKAS